MAAYRYEPQEHIVNLHPALAAMGSDTPLPAPTASPFAGPRGGALARKLQEEREFLARHLDSTGRAKPTATPRGDGPRRQGRGAFTRALQADHDFLVRHLGARPTTGPFLPTAGAGLPIGFSMPTPSTVPSIGQGGVRQQTRLRGTGRVIGSRGSGARRRASNGRWVAAKGRRAAYKRSQ